VKWGRFVLIAAAVAAVAVVYVAPGSYRWLLEYFEWGQTTGEIFVSGPQVYTRERLVNDRYREDAWLLAMLDTSTKETYGPAAALSRTERSGATINAQAGTSGPAGGSAPPASPASASTATSAPPVGADAGGAAPPSALAGVDRFDLQRQYREHVRTLMIENQLDDRHDLRGNSLYRLGFDVAVLPGRDTRKSAKISVAILPPEGLLGDVTDASGNDVLRATEEKLSNISSLSDLGKGQSVWEKLYLRWLDSLGTRFDDARRSLRTSYDGNRFSPDEYERLIDTIAQSVRGWAHIDREREPRLESASFEQSIEAAIPSVPDHWSRDSFVGLAKAIATVPDATGIESFRAAHATELDGFRKNYRAGQVHLEDKGHQIYKDEIDHLIDLVAQEKLLWAFLDFYANPPPKALLATVSAETTPANECENLIKYFSQQALPQETSAVVTGALAGGGEQTDSYDLTYFLDVAFEGTLAKSVLGLLPDPTRREQARTKVSALKELSPLAEVEVRYGVPNRAFFFKPRTAGFVVVDDDKCLPAAWRIYTKAEQVSGNMIYVRGDQIDALQNVVHDYDWGREIHQAYPDGKVPQHAGTIEVSVGLINFVRSVGRRLDAFSYAFTPSEPTEFTATKTSSARSRGLSFNANVGALEKTVGGETTVSHEEQTDRAGNAPRDIVISFGDQKNSASPTFGWFIEPQEPIDDTGAYRQRTSQTSLAALISLPAWWDEVRLKVKRSWVDESKKTSDASKKWEDPLPNLPDFTIELPVNFETVDASLFETIDRNPVILEGAGEGLTVKPCATAEIVIPGRRLWRSTVVTLGGQKANEIFVLPDMNGIIATFKQVHFPNGSSGDGSAPPSVPHHEPLTVWTSQGSATLPIPVTFEAADVKASACPPPPSPLATQASVP
jgi:hypothetical protein